MSFGRRAVLFRDVPQYFVDHHSLRDHGDHPHFCATSRARERRNLPDFLNEPRAGLPSSFGELVGFSQGLIRGDRRADPYGQLLAASLLSPFSKSTTRVDAVPDQPSFVFVGNMHQNLGYEFERIDLDPIGPQHGVEVCSVDNLFVFRIEGHF